MMHSYNAQPKFTTNANVIRQRNEKSIMTVKGTPSLPACLLGKQLPKFDGLYIVNARRLGEIYPWEIIYPQTNPILHKWLRSLLPSLAMTFAFVMAMDSVPLIMTDIVFDLFGNGRYWSDLMFQIVSKQHKQ